jgi:hypothetical protein
MLKTLFAGLTQLDPQEPLSTDNWSFQAENPLIIDRLLEVGAVTHRHDGHAALADPSTAPSAVAYSSGGTIPGDLSIEFGYTLIDADGGETAVSPIDAVTTPQQIGAPSGAITATADYTAGQLRSATYYYARTFVDGGGGETPLGAMRTVDVDPGHLNARVLLAGLSGGMAAVGAAGWRLYRARDGGSFTYLASGSGNTLIDDGTLCVDCTSTPPEFNTTQSFNRVEVTIPARPLAAAEWRLYGTVQSGIWDLFSLVGSGTGSAQVTRVLTSFAPARGRPPARSHALRGASQIDPDTDLFDWHWLRPVADVASLPSGGNASGDARVTLTDGHIYIWHGEQWKAQGGGGGGGGTEAVGDFPGTPASGVVPQQVGDDPGRLWIDFDVAGPNVQPKDVVDDLELSLWYEGHDSSVYLLPPGVVSLDDPDAYAVLQFSTGASAGTGSAASARAVMSHHADRGNDTFLTFTGMMQPPYETAFSSKRGKLAAGTWKLLIENYSTLHPATLRFSELNFRRRIRRESMSFEVMGDVSASGTVRIPPKFVAAPAYTVPYQDPPLVRKSDVRIVRVIHQTLQGSASATLRKNGTDITSLKNLLVDATADSKLVHEKVSPDDTLELAVTLVSGTPKGMTFTVHLETGVPPLPFDV